MDCSSKAYYFILIVHCNNVKSLHSEVGKVEKKGRQKKNNIWGIALLYKFQTKFSTAWYYLHAHTYTHTHIYIKKVQHNELMEEKRVLIP